MWVLYPKKHSGLPGPRYSDLVEEALCFGWIDGVVRSVPLDGMTSIRLSPRRPGSVWAQSNHARVAAMEAAGLMTEAGRAAVERAKRDGSWGLLKAVESDVIEGDLAAALDASPGRREAFFALPRSRRQQLLYGLYSAKRAATREKRLMELVRTLESKP